MSNSEKYLDDLLMNSMNGNNQQTDDVQADAGVLEGAADEGMAGGCYGFRMKIF